MPVGIVAMAIWNNGTSECRNDVEYGVTEAEARVE
jgi:hypothetical protein